MPLLFARKTILFLLLPLSLTQADDLSLEVDVTDYQEEQQDELDLNNRVESSPIIDAGKLIERETGVSAARKAGRGFEPIIRGQQQSQLNILLDGTSLHGACPGRMDPPTSYVTPVGYDKVRILHGFESVLYGAGGSGGTVLFERDEQPLSHKTGFTGSATGNYSDNSRFKSLNADMTASNDRGLLRIYGAHQKAGNYQDGSGETVSSAFKSLSGGVLLALELTNSLRMEINTESSRDDDIHYAGSAMDAPWANSDSWRLRMSQQSHYGWFDALEFQTWYSKTSHLMDNYTVRKRSDNSLGIRTPSEAITHGARLTGSVTSGVTELVVGTDFQRVEKTARRYRVNLQSGSEQLQANIWPEVQNQQMGIFSELNYGLSEQDALRVGFRLDDLSSEADRRLIQQLASNSPESLYQKYYKTSDRKEHEFAVSALVSWQHDLATDQTLKFKVSRNVRPANATERFVASRGSCCHGSDDWVGNPKIKSEIHHQFDMSYQQSFELFDWSITAWLDEVSDYILRYESTSGAYLYGNRDARIFGFDTDLYFSTESWTGRVGLSWLQGENRSEHKPLPQIPPLTANVQLDYQALSWLLGARLELVSSQNRIDSASGLDAGESSGYGVVHFYGKYQLTNKVTLNGGVKNLFNRAYSAHINRASKDPFNPEATRVNEPGREIWLSATAVF